MAFKRLHQERWRNIQAGERDYHERKDPSAILKINLRYWRRILDALAGEVRIEQGARALDIGCGGCGILLALPEGGHVGIDPLMDFYLDKFPFLKERKDITWRAGTGEDLEPGDQFDLVFLINTLDHTFDPGRALDKAAECVAPGGRLVILLNCHNTRIFRWYFSTFYRFIDPHHPFQFSPGEIENGLSGFSLSILQEIDHLWFPDDEDYRKMVLKKKKRDPLRFMKKALNPFMYPIAVSRYLFRRPTRRRKPGDRSIISIYLFVFRKDV
ncbi:class I SAM-dependent methyltransferase [Acidobacteriota bacterium]